MLTNTNSAKMAATVWNFLLLVYLVPVCLASGVLEMHMISFSSNCEEAFGDDCDHYFTFCFDRAGNTPSINSCYYKSQTTGRFDNQNYISFGSSINGVLNPIIVSIPSFSDPRVLVVMRSMDHDGTSGDDHVVTVHKTLSLSPASSRTRASYRSDSLSSGSHRFTFEYKAYCNNNRYGSKCDVYCLAQDNDGGHYTCNVDTGAKICNSGWEGDNCAQDIDECQREPDICYSSSQVHNKTCVNLPGSHTCACPAEWKGDNCEQDVDECVELSSSPCQNGGTCNNTIGSYRCDCPANWSGSHCTDDVDECADDRPSPCTLPNTQCSNSMGGYSCPCVEGWKGDKCTEDVDECQETAMLCKNGGNCTNINGSYRCDCPDNWSGPTCTDDVDECSGDLPSPCPLPNTFCSNSQGGYSCPCVEAWKGDNCTEDVNECEETAMLCKNGGNCSNLPGSYRCECPDNWTGATCTDDVDECSAGRPSPCTLPNTQCNNTQGGYSCPCVVGWRGDNCTEDVDECQEIDILCKNGGNCSNTPGSFRCDCPNNWTGANCTEDVDECASHLPSPCILPNHRCLNLNGSYDCVCEDGWRGENCTEDIDECAESNTTCQNGGNCTNSPGSYSCECPPNWAGFNCADDFDECSSRSPPACAPPNYKCQNSIGSFSCSCNDGWRGDNCTQDVDECQEGYVTCENNGTCVNFAGGFRCVCMKGWGGVACTVDIDECADRPCKSPDTRCVNLRGSFECACLDGSDDCEVITTGFIREETTEAGFQIWQIIVAAVVVLFIIVIIIVVIVVCRRRRRKRMKPALGRPPSAEEVGRFTNDTIMFENTLYHQNKRRTGSTNSNASSNPSARGALPTPPMAGWKSDYDMFTDDAVIYHDIEDKDDAGYTSMEGAAESERDRHEQGVYMPGYANGHVTGLDTRLDAGVNRYEDFDAMQQAADGQNRLREDAHGYMEPNVLRESWKRPDDADHSLNPGDGAQDAGDVVHVGQVNLNEENDGEQEFDHLHGVPVEHFPQRGRDFRPEANRDRGDDYPAPDLDMLGNLAMNEDAGRFGGRSDVGDEEPFGWSENGVQGAAPHRGHAVGQGEDDEGSGTFPESQCNNIPSHVHFRLPSDHSSAASGENAHDFSDQENEPGDDLGHLPTEGQRADHLGEEPRHEDGHVPEYNHRDNTDRVYIPGQGQLEFVRREDSDFDEDDFLMNIGYAGETTDDPDDLPAPPSEILWQYPIYELARRPTDPDRPPPEPPTAFF